MGATAHLPTVANTYPYIYNRELVAPHLSNVENLSYSHLGALRLSFSLRFAHR